MVILFSQVMEILKAFEAGKPLERKYAGYGIKNDWEPFTPPTLNALLAAIVNQDVRVQPEPPKPVAWTRDTVPDCLDWIRGPVVDWDYRVVGKGPEGVSVVSSLEGSSDPVKSVSYMALLSDGWLYRTRSKEWRPCGTVVP